MIRLLGILLLLAAAGLAAAWVADESGSLVFEWRGWRVRTSPAVLAVAALAALALAAFLGIAARWAFGVPGRVRGWSGERRRRKGWRALEAGLAAAAGGDRAGVLRALRGVRSLPADAPLRLLLEAQAAALGEDSAKTREALERMAGREETELAALRGLVAEARRDGRDAAAMDLAERAAARDPAPEWALREGLELALRLGRWERAAELLKAMRRRGLVAARDAERRLGLVAIERARAHLVKSELQPASRAAGEALAALPGYAPAARIAGEAHLAAGEPRAAARAAEAAWRVAPHPDLVEVVLDARGRKDAMGDLRIVEGLAAAAPEAAEGHLALAGAALRAEVWGLARDHLRRAMAAAPDARAYRLRAELERSEHRDEEAAARWLQRALEAPAGPAWTCGVCGARARKREWSALCRSCGEFDSMEWRAAPAAAPAGAAA